MAIFMLASFTIAALTMCESCFKLIYALLHLGIAMAKSSGYVGEKENINYTTCPLGSCTFFLWPCVH
jgi:hypothetical protein